MKNPLLKKAISLNLEVDKKVPSTEMAHDFLWPKDYDANRGPSCISCGKSYSHPVHENGGKPFKGRSASEKFTYAPDKYSPKLIRRSDGLLSDDPILGEKVRPDLWPKKE